MCSFIKIHFCSSYKALGWALLLLGLLPLVSCLPEPLEVKNVPAVKPQIVVSSQYIPDGSLLVFLSRTFSALDYSEDSEPAELLSQIALNDARVSLRGPEGTEALQFLGNGFYGIKRSSFQAGALYELFVKSESLGDVYASTRVLEQVALEELDISLHFNGFGDTLALVNYDFNDPKGPNWYLLNVQKFQRETFSQNLLNPRAFTSLFDDAAFEGQPVEGFLRFEADDYAAGDTIVVSLSNISEEYHRFVKLRLDNRFSLMDFLGEPLNYPSNVVGGKGYFNLHVPDVEIVVLE